MNAPVSIAPSADFERLVTGAQFRDRIARRVQAPADVTIAALQQVTLADMPVAWVLGEIRYWPMRLAGHLPPATPQEPFLQTLLAGGTLVLHETPGRELITGSAGRLHRIDQQPVSFTSRAAFDAFENGHFQKLFMSLRVTPTDEQGGCWLVLEHATRALSRSSERAFGRYWRIIKPVGAFVTGRLLAAAADRAEKVAGTVRT